MQQQTVYIQVPISTPPKKDGTYVLVHRSGAKGSMSFLKGGWSAMTASVTHWLKPQTGYFFTPDEYDALKSELESLKAWKESAIAVMPDYQAIGKAMGVPLGQSVHDKILPYILNKNNHS